MKYGFVPEADAPPPVLERKKRRIAGLDELVVGLLPGQVARIELEEGERPRPLIEQLYQTAARHGKLLDLWETGGIFYAAVVTSDDHR